VKRRSIRILLAMGACFVVLASGAPTVLGAGPTIPGDRSLAAPPTEVRAKVLSYRGWIYGGQLHVVGEIRNTSAYRINGYVQFVINPGNAGGDQVLYGTVGLFNLAPNGRSPFHLIEDPFSQPVTYVLQASAGGYTGPSPAGAIGVSAIGPVMSDPNVATGNGDRVNVEVRNGTTRPVHVFQAIASFHGADGKVSNLGIGLPDVVLLPGESATGIVSGAASGKKAVRAEIDVFARFEDALNEGVVSWQNWFHDISDESLRMSIAWLAEQGITGGCATFKYCPTANVTRAQMAIFLVRAFALPAATGPDHFSDDNGKTGESSINALFESGITGGCKPGLFCPSANVTRAQMAIFLVRALGLPAPLHDHFSDDNGMTGESQINSLYEAGVTGGCATGKFCPKSPVTRAQMAAFLQRALP
jgi:hypothetical protein